jgi:hypothetical protein
MVLSTAWYLRCDYCGSHAPISTEGAVDARNMAADEGFRREKLPKSGAMRDVCAGCRAKRAAGDE